MNGMQRSPEWLATYQARQKAAIERPALRLAVIPSERREPRINKYGNEKTAEGDSRKEVKRLQELRLLQAAGQITNLIPQVRYLLVPAVRKTNGAVERAVTYTCDAQYVEGGKLVVEDVKSEATRTRNDYIIKRKLMKQLYDIEILEI